MGLTGGLLYFRAIFYVITALVFFCGNCTQKKTFFHDCIGGISPFVCCQIKKRGLWDVIQRPPLRLRNGRTVISNKACIMPHVEFLGLELTFKYSFK